MKTLNKSTNVILEKKVTICNQCKFQLILWITYTIVQKRLGISLDVETAAWNLSAVTKVILLYCIRLCVCAQWLSHVWLYDPVDCRLLCPWDFPGKNTGASCYLLLQRICPTQGLNSLHLSFLHCRQIFYHWATGKSILYITLVIVPDWHWKRPMPTQERVFWLCRREPHTK